MIDFTKKTVAEIRDMLVKMGVSREQAESIKGKSELVEALYSVMENGTIEVPMLSEVEVEEGGIVQNLQDTESEESEAVEVVNPKIGSEGWEEFVISHLNEKEFDVKNGKKYPKAAGLRRVAQLLLGPIVFSGPRQVFPPSAGNDIATVIYDIEIMWTHGMTIAEWMPENELMNLKIPVRRFSEAADCTDDNTPNPFCKHKTATASSRAEGRAFRKALQLNITTAEEMNMSMDEVAVVTESINEDELITQHQKISIATLIDNLNLDLNKTISYHGFGSDFSKVSRVNAGVLMGILNRYQSKGEGSWPIPEEIKNGNSTEAN